jgi:parvulin-like peptidyl-prolyl isomerase
MIGQMRGKIGGWIITGVIGLIALVFALEGVFGPKSTRGLHEGAVAGTVNGEPITIGDYNKALERKLEFLKGMMGGKVTDEQIKMFRVREGVFQELTQQKLMAQAALSSGRQPSDEAVRQEISGLPYFLKDGKFDPAQYRATLQANNYTTALFEKMIREQLAVQDWTQSFGNQVRVSDAEVKDEYLRSKNIRTYKIVSIPASAPKTDDKSGGLTPKAAAEKVASLLKAGKKSDDAVNAVLKPFGVTVREVPEASEAANFVPGAEDHPELVKELFGNGLSVGKAKIYESPTRISVVLVTEAKKPDLAKFESEKKTTLLEIKSRKERDLMNEVLKKLTEKASIVSNPAVVSSSDSEST